MAFDLGNSKPFPTVTGERKLEFNQAPINKVGLVLLRHAHSEDPEVCLVQVKAKNPAEQDKIDFGLPKGTRQYYDAPSNSWKDARTFLEASDHASDLEDLSVTLMKEAEEEIGLGKRAFASAAVYDLGSKLFQSRNSRGEYTTPYDIQWYLIEANRPMVEGMDPNPQDAHCVQWFKLSDVRAMEVEGKINPCYVDVLEEAVARMREQKLRPAQFVPAQPTR